MVQVMRRSIITLVIVSVVTLLFPYHPKLDARKNPFSGILPPQRLNSAVDINAELMTEEPAEPVYPDLHIIVNIPARKVTLYDDGNEVLRHDVAVGQPGYKTPAGPQEIKTIIWNPWWIPPDSPWARGSASQPPGPKNCLGPVKMMMGQGIRMHGTNVDSSVGRFASHGCLRMHNEEAAKLAWYLQKRMNNSDESLFEKYSRYRRSSFYVKLDYPVRVDIVYQPVEVRDNVIYIYNDVYGWARDIKTEIIDALMKNGIDIKKIDSDRIANLKYPQKRYDVIQIDLTDLLASTPAPRDDACYATRE